MDLITKAKLSRSDKSVCVLTTIAMLSDKPYRTVKSIAKQCFEQVIGYRVPRFDWFTALCSTPTDVDGYNVMVKEICRRVGIKPIKSSAMHANSTGELLPVNAIDADMLKEKSHMSLLIKLPSGKLSGHSVACYDGFVYDYNLHCPLIWDMYLEYVKRFGWTIVKAQVEVV